VVSGAHDWLSQASVCPWRCFLHRLSCEVNAFGVNKRRFGQKDCLCNILILPPSLASNLVGPDNMSGFVQATSTWARAWRLWPVGHGKHSLIFCAANVRSFLHQDGAPDTSTKFPSHNDRASASPCHALTDIFNI
jgi:hypothetical protein